MLASEEGLCSMELIRKNARLLVHYIFSQAANSLDYAYIGTNSLAVRPKV